MLKILSTVALIVSLFASPVLASDLQQQQNPLYPYQSSIFLQDEFFGSDTSVSIGSLGWSVNGGSTSNAAATSTRIGLLNRQTGAAIVNAYLFLYSTTSQAYSPAFATDMTWIFRPNTVDANTEYRLGGFSGIVSNPPADGIYIEKVAADTNWFCVARNANVQTRVDSGIAVTASTFYNLRHIRNSTGVQYQINGVSVCGTISTNLPTANISPDAMIASTAAANKTMDIDYFQVIWTGLVR